MQESGRQVVMGTNRTNAFVFCAMMSFKAPHVRQDDCMCVSGGWEVGFFFSLNGFLEVDRIFSTLCRRVHCVFIFYFIY